LAPNADQSRPAGGRSWFPVPAGGLVAVFTLLLYVAQPPLLTRLDLKIYDLWLPLRAAAAPSPVPAVIDLDEASLAAHGQWPWPRYLVVDLLEALAEYGVAAIGLDILLAEADRSSPERMRADLLRDRGQALAWVGLPPELQDYDRLLAETLPRVPVALGAYARFEGGPGAAFRPDSPTALTIIERDLPGARPSNLPPAAAAVLPLPLFRAQAPLGFLNAAPDSDGVVREVPLVIKLGAEFQPALSLRALMLALGTRRLTLVSGLYGLEAIQVGEYTAPVSPRGTLRLPFLGPRRTYPYFSAAEVLRRAVPPEALQGRVVFVGSSAAGLMDLKATPYDNVYPGVELHAAALDALLTGNAIQIPPWAPAGPAVGLVFVALASALVFSLARPWVYPPAVALLVTAAIVGSRQLFAAGLFLSPLYALLAVAAESAVFLLWRFRREEKQKRALYAAFSRYVSPEIVKRIAKRRGDLWSGEERELSILFTDIRGFTSISEKLSPWQTVNLLNRYFTPMTALVWANGGTLDKFIGDALMAFWNAPLNVPNHSARAVTAALAMRTRLADLNEELRADFGVSIRIGAGIHSGPVYVGNMGSQELINYTIIGDNVNLASRLEGLCSQYGVGLVVSEETRAGCGESWEFQYLDTLRVKGKTRPVRVYIPLERAEAAARRAELDAWQEVRGLYLAGDFARAAEALAELQAGRPEVKLYAVYADRARRLRDEPPDNWDGVWTLTSK
jgi:adenylate cyclase